MVIMRSCCCCSPRTGSLLIAVLYMFFTGLVLLGLGLLLAYFKSLKPLMDSIVRDVSANDRTTLNITSELSSTTAVRNVIIAGVILNSFYFSLCLVLFIGVVKESWRILVPWTMAELVRQLLFFAAFVFLAWCFSILVRKKRMDYGTYILLCVLMLIVKALAFYFWLAVIAAIQGYRERGRQVSPQDIKLAYPHSDMSLINQ